MIAAALYLRGHRCSRSPWRDASFAIGIVLLIASSVWPVESLARAYFAVHELDFLSLRIVAPMLIALSHPAGTLLRGVPRRWRTIVIARPLSNTVVRTSWRVARTPPVALLAYLAALYIWAIPILQDAALRHVAVALSLHVSLFVTGLLFWSRIFDRRPEPHGMRHSVRLLMLWLAILSQIVIGSATTLKRTLWYPGYGFEGHHALADEMVGGILLWIPSSFLTLLGLLLVVDMWGRHETRMDLRRTQWSPSNSAILLYPQTAHALREMAAPKNRRTAVAMGAFALFILTAAFVVATVYRYS